MRAQNLLVGCVLGFLISCGGEEPKAADKTPGSAPAAAAKTAPSAPDSAPAATAQGDCPAAMAEYEAAVDKYVAYKIHLEPGILLGEKALQRAGDSTFKEARIAAMSQGQDLKALAEQAGTKVANIRSDLTADCLKRYKATSKKMTKAHLDLSLDKLRCGSLDKLRCAKLKEMQQNAHEAAQREPVDERAVLHQSKRLRCIESCQKDLAWGSMELVTCVQKCQ